MTAGLPRWKVLGWSARPRNARERRLVLEGRPEPTRRVGDRPPCRACGSRASRWRRDRRVKGGRTRECIPCEQRSVRRDRARHRERVNTYQREWIRAKRARLRGAGAAPSHEATR